MTALSHDALLIFIVQFAVLLLFARGLGLAGTRLGLPSVVGELVAGLILGPTVLGTIAPGLREAIFPADPAQIHLIEIISFVGVMLLLVLTGLETDLALILSRRRQAMQISLGGIVVPFVTGVGAALLLPDRFLVDASQRVTFALFIGTAMSISAIPVIAKVLIELKVIRRDIGQLTLAAGMIDDTMGWILLSIVAGLARSGSLSARGALTSIATVLVFLLLAFTVGRMLVTRLVGWVSVAVPGTGPLLTLLIVLALTFAAITQSLGIEAVLGAFVLGIIAGQIRRVDHHLVQNLETVTLAVFAPVFFASAGLQVDLRALADPAVLAIGVAVLVVAIAGKFVGAYAGATVAGLGRIEALSLGAGMNARGALEIIVASIGLSLGVLTPELFTVIVMMAIVTSLMAPPLLRYLLPKVPMTDEEAARLARESQEKSSLLGGVHRILLPTRGGTNSQLAAQLVAGLAKQRGAEVAILHAEVAQVAVGDAGPPAATDHAAADRRLDRIQAHLSGVRTRRAVRTIRGGVAEALLAEAGGGGYDLLVIGATHTPDEADAALFSPDVDAMLMGSPCPVLIIHSRLPADRGDILEPLALRRILVPTSGTDPERRAPEIGFALARAGDVPVDVVRVVNPPQDTWAEIDLGQVTRARQIGEEVAAAEAAPGLAAGVAVTASVDVTEESFGRAVVRLARDRGCDLIVLRCDIQPVSRRAFFGHDLEHVLRHAPCPVAVITRA